MAEEKQEKQARLADVSESEILSRDYQDFKGKPSNLLWEKIVDRDANLVAQIWLNGRLHIAITHFYRNDKNEIKFYSLSRSLRFS